jgi:type IV secretion system protein VirD4
MSISLSPSGSKPGLVGSGLVERAIWIVVVLLPVYVAVRWPIVSAIIGLVLFFRLAAVRANSSAYGSARWAEYEDLKNAQLLGPTGRILGRCLGMRARLLHAVKRLFIAPLSDSREVCQYFRLAVLGGRCPGNPLIRLPKSIHTLVVAPPGAGKGVGIVIPNLLTYRKSVVTIDPKGELFKITARVRRRHWKNKIFRLDPLGVCGPGGAQLNPLDFIDPKSPAIADQCSAIADALVVQTGKETDPHWNQAAALAICGALMYVVTYAAPEDRILNAAVDLLTDQVAFSGMVAMMRDVDGDLAKTHGHLYAYRLLQRYGNTMSSWADRELSSILSSVGRHLSWLHSPLVEEHLSASSFDPRDLSREAITVYLILPPKYLETLSRLLRLWITTIYGTITEGGPREENEVLFMLDEAGSLGPLPSLYSAIILGRGYGLRVVLILQSISQLKSLFPKDGEHQTVDASIDNKMFFGVRDYATAEMVSNYVGTSTITVASHTTSAGSSVTGSVLGAIFGNEKITRSTNQGTSATRSETGRKLLMPDELIQLPADMAILLIKGVPPVRAWLAKYYEAPEMAEVMPDVGKVM